MTTPRTPLENRWTPTMRRHAVPPDKDPLRLKVGQTTAEPRWGTLRTRNGGQRSPKSNRGHQDPSVSQTFVYVTQALLAAARLPHILTRPRFASLTGSCGSPRSHRRLELWIAVSNPASTPNAGARPPELAGRRAAPLAPVTAAKVDPYGRSRTRRTLVLTNSPGTSPYRSRSFQGRRTRRVQQALSDRRVHRPWRSRRCRPP